MGGALLIIPLITYMTVRWQRRLKLAADERKEAEMSRDQTIVFGGGAWGDMVPRTPPPYTENEALGYVFSSGVQPLRYEDVNPPHMWMTARESSAGNPYDNLPNSGSATGNSFDNASYDNV